MKLKILIGLTLLCACYLIVVGVMYGLQNRLTFFPDIAESRAPEDFPQQHFKKITLTTKDNVTLQGVRAHPLRPNQPNVVFFGGNAQNLTRFAGFLRTALPQVNLVGFNYRGFGESAGTPTKKHLLQDVHPVALWVRAHMPATPTYSLGLSLGTGPATKYAALTNTAGLFLVMPYDTLANVAKDSYPWLPVHSLLTNNVQTTQFMADYGGKVAIIVGAADDLIKPERSKALAAHAQNLVAYNEIPGKTHTSMIGSQALAAWITTTFEGMRQEKKHKAEPTPKSSSLKSGEK